MKLRIPPPVIAFISGGLMWMITKFSPVGHINMPGRRPLYYILMLMAVALTVLSISGFNSAKTTIDPRKPAKASSLVTEGIYKWTRNPMYLALLFLLGAWTVYLGNFINLGILVLFVYYITEFQIKPEEDALREKFGEAFESYNSSVRRWL